MSIGLWQMLNQQPAARTDAEVAANIMRMVAMWPQMREDISRERDTRYAETLRAQGVEPGSEAFARQFQAKRKIEIPYTAFRSGEQFATEFPEHYTQIASQIENVAAPFLTQATPEIRDRAMKAVMGMVRGGQFPVHYDPTTKKFIVDSARAFQALQAVLPSVMEMVSKMPQTETFGTYLTRTNPALAKIMESNAELRAHAALPVDVREPQRAMGAFLGELRNHADSILSGTQLAVAAVKVDPSPATLAAAVSAVSGVEELVRQGVIPAAAAKGLLATAQAYRNQAMDVRMPDGRMVSMPGNDAQQFVNQRLAFHMKQAEQVGAALAQRPTDPVLRRAKDQIIAAASKEGLDVFPLFQAVFGKEQLDFQKARMELLVTNQRLANAHQEHAAQGLQIRQLGISLGREEEKKRLWDRALKTGTISTWSPSQRVFMGIQDDIDLPAWANYQKLHATEYKAAIQLAYQAKDRNSARLAFTEVLGGYRSDRAVNEMGMDQRVVGPLARESTVVNLRAGKNLLPEIVRFVQQRWVRPEEAADFVREMHSELTLAGERGVFGDLRDPKNQRGFLEYRQAIAAAEKAINTPITTPGWWDWLRNRFKIGFAPGIGIGPVPR